MPSPGCQGSFSPPCPSSCQSWEQRKQVFKIKRSRLWNINPLKVHTCSLLPAYVKNTDRPDKRAKKLRSVGLNLSAQFTKRGLVGPSSYITDIYQLAFACCRYSPDIRSLFFYILTFTATEQQQLNDAKTLIFYFKRQERTATVCH